VDGFELGFELIEGEPRRENSRERVFTCNIFIEQNDFKRLNSFIL
jgi:hypothetical protein